MHIVVAMKQIPDLQQVRIRDRKPVFDDIVYTYGDLDKNALEAAVQLKEAAPEGDVAVTVLSIGDEELEETVKEALAAGADDAYLIADDEYKSLESGQVAQLIKEAIANIGDVDALFVGEGSGDSYSGQMAGRVAELLEWPQIGYVREVDFTEGKATVVRALEDTVETFEAVTPVLLSFSADANEARVPKVTQILKAGRKPKEVLDSTDVSTDLPDAAVRVISGLAPLNDRKGAKLATVEEFVEAIKSENIL